MARPITVMPCDQIRAHAHVLQTVHFEIRYDLASGTYPIFQVPAGTFVHTVGTVVYQAMDGSPTLTIGDGDDTDGYLDSTDIAPGTAGSVTTPAIKLSEDGGNPYANGKYYAVADTIDAVWVIGTSPTTGVLKGFITYSDVTLDGIAVAAGEPQ